MSFPAIRMAAAFLLAASLCTTAVAAAGLSLAEAGQLALHANPRLAAARAALLAARGDARQAALLHNPELLVTRDNMGNARLSGFDGPATYWQLSQRLELNGQHEARREAARHDADASAARLTVTEAEVLAEVRTAWIELLAAQRRMQLAEELQAGAARTRVGVLAQIQAGKVSPVAADRLAIAEAGLQRRQDLADVTLTTARLRLASLLGLRADQAPLALGEFPPRLPMPALAQVSRMAENSPLLREQDALTAARASDLEFADASRYPDITVSVGRRHYELPGESSWQAGISLPLPLFNRNQGARQAAGARLAEARASATGARLGLSAELSGLHAEVNTLLAQLERMEQQVLPASTRTSVAIDKGYRYGKFGLLDVLDAQRNDIDARFDYLDTLSAYYRQRNRFDALAGAREELPQ
ncbi:MAG: TolC family protein [Perlucidibaca sp.]